MTDNERALFEKLAKDRKESAVMLEKRSMRGLKSSVVEKYSDQAHFIYELIQNADDVGATEVRFELFEDRLVFIHNGTRLFTVSDLDTEEEDSQTGALGDINAITSIANSNKTSSSIGKFGVGFKAVFQYTTTPVIYDPDIAFRIERFIVPVLIENNCDFKKSNETAFVFPFNHPDRKKDEAYEDILHKLRNLLFPTLFLNSLKKVSYRCGREYGEYEKTVVEEKYFDDTKAEYLTFKNGNDQDATNKMWLFSRTSEEGHTYSCGFFIDDNNILVNTDYYAFCFFPTKKDTNLNFIINAPFLLTDSREGIKATDSHNIRMIECLASLAADSFIYLRDIGNEIGVQILDDDIFNYIPIHKDLYTPRNPRDDLSLLPFYEEIEKVFSTEEILPSYDGYVRAKDAYLAYASTTTEIISNDQLKHLVKNPKAKWVIPSKGGEALYRTSDGRYAYLSSLISKAMIYDYQIYEMISAGFTEKQSTDWLYELYEFTLDKSSRIEKCKSSPIFIDKNGEAVSAFDSKGNAILFIDEDANSDYRTISDSLLNNKYAKELVERLGIKSPELKDKIYNVILKKEKLDPITDFRIFLDYYIELIENNKDTQSFINEIRNREFVIGESEDKSIKDVYKGSDLYLPSDELLYYFKGAGQNAYFVASSDYMNVLEPKELLHVDRFLKDLGVDINVQLITKTYSREQVEKLFGTDWHRSNRTPVWSEQYIHNDQLVLDRIRDNNDKDLSVYLWNQLLLIFEDNYYYSQFYTGTYEYFFRTEYIQHFEGIGECRLKYSKWIFDKNGRLCSPDEISLQDMAYEYSLAGNYAKKLVDFLEIRDEHPEYDELDDELRVKLENYDRLVSLGFDNLSDEELAYIVRHLKELRSVDNVVENTEKEELKNQTEKKILDDIKERFEENKNKEETDIEEKLIKNDKKIEKEKDNDEITKAPVDYSKKIEAAKEKFESEIELLAQIEEAQEKVNNSNRYSYGWFSGLLELEAIENGEENSRSREVSISFSKVVREEGTNRTLILKHPDKNIPQVMEELVDIPLELTFNDGSSKRLIIEVANVKSYTLKVKVKPDDFINTADFESVTMAKIVTQNPSFLLRELQKQFKRFEEKPYQFSDEYDMQMNLCENIDFIFGPPGTGKTTYLANETIIPLVNKNKKLRMIVLAPTNKAADVLVSRIMESMGDNHSYEEWLVRYGITGDEKIESSPVFKGKEFEIDDYEKCVIVTTMVRFPYDFFIDSDGDFNYLYGINWDYIVVDEASMIPLIYMVYMLYLKTPKRFIIAGDPFQIEPTVAVSEWSGENIYKMVGLMNFSDDVDTVPYKYSIKLLTTQYRSIPSIGDVYSKLTYNGVLKHYRIEETQRKLNIDDYIESESLNIIKFPVSRYESIYRAKRLKFSNYQVYSALFTFEFVSFLSKAIARKQQDKFTIGIIAPYSSQAGLIDKLIASADIPNNINIQSGTIHGFQGDECDVIIAVFNPPPYISTNKEMFLNRQNIINVAISRARDYLFVLMPDDKTENVSNLTLIKNLERLIKSHDYSLYEAHELEELMFGDSSYLEDNAFSTGHQLVNVYGLPEKRYEIRSEENALDVQVHGKSEYIIFDDDINTDKDDNTDEVPEYDEVANKSEDDILIAIKQLIIGEQVFNLKFGYGTIKDLDGFSIWVDFNSVKNKKFPFPDSIGRMLRFKDKRIERDYNTIINGR